MWHSNIHIKLRYQILFFSAFLFFIIFLVTRFEFEKEKFGYKKDYSERNNKISAEIEYIIKPYKIYKKNHAQQGPLSINNFYIKGTEEDYKKINSIIENKIPSIGFNGVCRDKEAIFISFDDISNQKQIIIQWRYPVDSCK
ncbi:hypothetical protein PL75_04200 [Neisseria arctica]|uniref:Uncharacterized protein n=1 Tax=Neisseria arctica TaxID=1470200 RepID=A0A0J1C483_9NEIS|nr:hypothetical protein [Neisseria arctica]KLT73118.1 hypothetical protein PL75_04200 [Neisseria arctica]UOO87155.1 hypothetical protein LVJ86_02575 [Neisseria arctica]